MNEAKINRILYAIAKALRVISLGCIFGADENVQLISFGQQYHIVFLICGALAEGLTWYADGSLNNVSKAMLFGWLVLLVGCASPANRYKALVEQYPELVKRDTTWVTVKADTVLAAGRVDTLHYWHELHDTLWLPLKRKNGSVAASVKVVNKGGKGVAVTGEVYADTVRQVVQVPVAGKIYEREVVPNWWPWLILVGAVVGWSLARLVRAIG